MKANLAPDLDPRSHGVGRLGDSGAFEIEQTEGRRWRVRLKPETAATPTPTRRRRPPAPRAT